MCCWWRCVYYDTACLYNVDRLLSVKLGMFQAPFARDRPAALEQTFLGGPCFGSDLVPDSGPKVLQGRVHFESLIKNMFRRENVLRAAFKVW